MAYFRLPPFDKMTIEICVSAYPQTFSDISLLLGVGINKEWRSRCLVNS